MNVFRTPSKIIRYLWIFSLCLFASISAYAEDTRQSATDNWYVTGYMGQLTTNDLLEFFEFKADFVESYMAALAIGKEFWRYHDYFSLELEGQVAKYFGDYTFECDSEECMKLPPEQRARKTQDHAEINAAIVLRWLNFPWDRYVDTSFAVGEGLSYATRVPAVEEDMHLATFGPEQETSNLLNYLMFEIAFALPGEQQWSLVARIHHRSSVFGLLADSKSGSNTIGVGLRYDFR